MPREKSKSNPLHLYRGVRLDSWQVTNTLYFDYSRRPGLKKKYSLKDEIIFSPNNGRSYTSELFCSFFFKVKRTSVQFSSVQSLSCVHEKELEKAKRCSFFKNFINAEVKHYLLGLGFCYIIFFKIQRANF